MTSARIRGYSATVAPKIGYKRTGAYVLVDQDDADILPFCGKLVKGGVKAEAKQALDNINETLLKYGYQKSDIVKCMAMLTDMDDFDDFNKDYKAELAKPYPVRSAFGVAELAAGASVEVECIAAK